MVSFLNSIGIEHTGVIITSFAITLVISVLAILSTRKMEMVPHGLQNVAEWAVGKLYGFFKGVMGETACKKYFPVVATLFIYILFCNYSGLLPMAGKTSWLAAPTSCFNTAAGLAIFVFFATQVIGFKEHHGPRYLLTFLQPIALLAPLMIVEQFTRALSLTLRLYGNIFGEESVVESFFELVPVGLPVVMQFLSVLMGLVQALVFSLLTAVYLAEVVEMAEEMNHQRLEKIARKNEALAAKAGANA